MVDLFLIFWGISIMFPTNSVQWSPFFSISAPLLFHINSNISNHFNDSHPYRCEVISPCSFDLHSPINRHLFMYLLAIYILSLEIHLFKSSAHFLIFLLLYEFCLFVFIISTLNMELEVMNSWLQDQKSHPPAT